MKKQKNDKRIREINRLVADTFCKFEPELQLVSTKLNNSMEINHFVADLGNRIAIIFGLEQMNRE